jgi:hypothetical protein
VITTICICREEADRTSRANCEIERQSEGYRGVTT